jgi:uncharacterized SAM-binding protein YcdF (DUF218 family)
MMAFIKEFVGAMASPLVMAMTLCIVAALLRWRAWRRASNALFLAAAVMLYLLSLPPVANLLMGSLENRFPPLSGISAEPRYVAVLGSSYAPRGDVPVTAALDPDGLARIAEGVRLLREWPATQLIVSGGPAGARAPARGYERFALEMGVDAARIQVLDSPANTASESIEIAARVQSDSLVLVTSAFHMPRAMGEMRRRGLQPLAGPTAFQVDRSRPYGLRSLIPTANALRRSEFATREYLALLAFNWGIGS